MRINLEYLLFNLALFLFLLPLIEFPIINSYTFAKLIILILCALLFSKNNLIENNLSYRISLLALSSVLLISQTAGVLISIDVSVFIMRFKEIIFLYIFLVVSIRLSLKNKNAFILNLIFIMSIAGLLNLIVQLVVFLNPHLFVKYSKYILNKGLFDLIQMNINRNRIYFPTYEEILIPILLLSLFSNSIIKKLASILFTALIMIIALASNFRTKLLMVCFSTSFAVLIYIKSIKVNKSHVITFLLITITICSIFGYIQNLNKTTTIDRVLLTEQTDIDTIISRLNQYKDSILIGVSHPLIGIGMGGFELYSNQGTSTNTTNKSIKLINQDAKLPHNIFFLLFAEGGFFSLFSFSLMLAYFIKVDFALLNSKDLKVKAIIISFWTLFIYSLFNPTTNTSYNILFFVLRSCIEGYTNNVRGYGLPYQTKLSVP